MSIEHSSLGFKTPLTRRKRNNVSSNFLFRESLSKMHMELPIFVGPLMLCASATHFHFRESLSKMHLEADKYNSGALVAKYEAGIKGFFKDEELVSLAMLLQLV